MQLEVVSRGAPAEALNAGAAAALAVFSKADMDPWMAMQAVGKIIHWDELGFPEDDDQLDLDGMQAQSEQVTPSAEDHAAARIYWDAADAAQEAIHARVPKAQQHEVSVGLAQPGDFTEKVRFAIADWLTRAVDDADDLLEVIRTGGLSATLIRPLSGVQVEVDLDRRPGPLASFGILKPADVLSEPVIDIARRWKQSLPAQPSSSEVLAVFHGDHRAAWAHIRHQLDAHPQLVRQAAEALQHI